MSNLSSTEIEKQFQAFLQANLQGICSTVIVDYKLLNGLKQAQIITEDEQGSILNERDIQERAVMVYKFVSSSRPEKLRKLTTSLNSRFVEHAKILATFTPVEHHVTSIVPTMTPTVTVNKIKKTMTMPMEVSEKISKMILKTRNKLNEPNVRDGRAGSVKNDATPVNSTDVGPSSRPNNNNDAIHDILTRCAQGPLQYPSTSSRKGLALLINIVTFKNEPRAYREGAYRDTDNLSNVLDEFGYLVYDLVNVTAWELREAIAEFQDLFKQQNVDSCIVAAMSHGKNESIITADGSQIGVWEIVEKFNNANCPQLIGKPKIFIFQYCRGDTTDLGRLQHDSYPIQSSPEPTIPTWTDMLVCYSTLDGHYAYRDTEMGSWFIQSICDVFRTFGSQYNICQLLNIVSEIMKNRVGGEGQKQICPWYNIGFTKEFYFANH